jgi:hypothetical protein
MTDPTTIEQKLAALLKGRMRSEDDSLKELARRLAALESQTSPPSLTNEELAEVLRRRVSLLLVSHQFKVADLIRWKEGLKNKKRPGYGQPAIVVEVLQEPVLDEAEGAGSAYFREPLDLIIGLLDPDGDFSTYHADGRRFEPYVSQAGGAGEKE